MFKQKLSSWLLIGSLLISLIIIALPKVLWAADTTGQRCIGLTNEIKRTCDYTSSSTQYVCDSSLYNYRDQCWNKFPYANDSGKMQAGTLNATEIANQEAEKYKAWLELIIDPTPAAGPEPYTCAVKIKNCVDKGECEAANFYWVKDHCSTNLTGCDIPCIVTQYCDGTNCVAKKSVGEPCEANNPIMQCASGVCNPDNTCGCTKDDECGNKQYCDMGPSVCKNEPDLTCNPACSADQYCWDQKCENKLDDKSDCTEDEQCISGNCDNSVCAPASTPPGDTGGGTTPGGTGGGTTPGGTGGSDKSSAGKLPNPIGVTTFNDLFAKLIKYIVGFTGSVALAVLIYGGVMYLISAGRQDYLGKAKKAVTQAILGIIIVFSSYLIVKLIISISEIGAIVSK